jgi:hypothetical protein
MRGQMVGGKPKENLMATPAAPAAQNEVIYVKGVGNGVAVGAMVCGIVGVVFGLIPILGIPALALGLVALVLGVVGRRRVKRDPKVGHKGLATAGVILGIAASGLGIAGIVIVTNSVNHLDHQLSSHCLNNPNASDCQ